MATAAVTRPAFTPISSEEFNTEGSKWARLAANMDLGDQRADLRADEVLIAMACTWGVETTFGSNERSNDAWLFADREGGLWRLVKFAGMVWVACPAGGNADELVEWLTNEVGPFTS